MNYSYLKYDTKLLLWQAFAFITILNSQRFTVISDNKTSLIPITKVKSWMGIVLRYWYLRYKGGDDANCRNKVTFLSNKGTHAELTVPAYPSCLNSSNKLLLLLKSQSLIHGSSEINIDKACPGNLKSHLSFVKFFNDFFLFFVDITNTHELNLPLSTKKFLSYLLNNSWRRLATWNRAVFNIPEHTYWFWLRSCWPLAWRSSQRILKCQGCEERHVSNNY